MASVDQEYEAYTGDLRVRKGVWRRASTRTPSIAVAVVALILLGSVWQAHAVALGNSPHRTGALSLYPQRTSSSVTSKWLAAGPADPVAQNSSSPVYDEQIGATFTENFTSLAYNVTVLAQTDADGYGPAYILNGMTAQDYFYQVSVSYHWPLQPGIYPSFGFGYDVFGPENTPVYPTSGGSGLDNFSSAVNSGDKVLLSLTFTGSAVQMVARDWNTGATAQTSFDNEGSSVFVGSPTSRSNFQGYFTGLMTEWYHVAPYSGNQRGVTYANDAVALTSAYVWIDEFNTEIAGPPLFSNNTRTTFANDQQLYPFFADGAMTYASAHEFITGLPATASASKVTLVPAAKERSTPSFSASFTLLGQPQTIAIPAGASILGADPGTSITISTSSGSSLFDRWVFDGTSGTEVTVAAGMNATYLIYHLVRELISYQVAAGGQALPASTVIELSYEIPPFVASSTAGSVPVTQLVGTTPVEIYALLGSNAGINGTVLGAAGERWVASQQNWSVTDGGLIPYPMEFYQQYEVSIGYSIVGGGTASTAPEFTAAFFGRPTSTPLTSVATTSWFDAGSAYSFTQLVNGADGTERWASSGEAGSASSVISSPHEALSEAYTAQYYARITVNDARGGTVTNRSGWFDRGSVMVASASANQGWHFEGWNGSGEGAYTGASPAINVVVEGPLNEHATFYVQLAITADAGTNIAFSYPSHNGTVQAGTTKTLDIPPSNVTLHAAPSFFVFSFTSWQGTSVADAKKPSVVLVVDSPKMVAGKSSYDYAGVLVLASGAVALMLNVMVGSRWIRGRREKRAPRGILRLATTSQEVLRMAVTYFAIPPGRVSPSQNGETRFFAVLGAGRRPVASIISMGVILIRIRLFCYS